LAQQTCPWALKEKLKNIKDLSYFRKSDLERWRSSRVKKMGQIQRVRKTKLGCFQDKNKGS
jgi:hypothetical protein